MDSAAFSRAVEVLSSADSILVFTGAGISTESGIPDFRGPNGLWTRLDPDDFTIARYLSSEAVRIRRWEMHKNGELWGARSSVQPNRAHHSITKLWRSGRLAGCITQNIDGLHLSAGLPPDVVAEVHGNVSRTRCLRCDGRWMTEEVLTWIDDGVRDPHCPMCGDLVKPTTVLFGELLPPEEIRKAEQFAAASDAVLAVGSTMSVYPATEFALDPVRRGAPLVIVNLGTTDHDHEATLVLDSPAGDVVPQLIDRLV